MRLHDVRAALRTLARRPGLTFTVILTLTLGIGANSAIFSAVDAVLLRPLPYPAADRLVSIHESNLERRQSTMLVAPGRLEEWQRMNRSFDGMAGSYFENVTDTTGALPERVEAMRISPRFFSVLGVAASSGRTTSPQEEIFGGPGVVVISDGFWRKRFNADPAAVGRSLTLGGGTRTVIGVMPPSFRYPTATTEVWIPAQAPAFLLQARQARFYKAIGRLRPGVTVEQAQADLSAVQARLGEQYPATDKGWAAALAPLKEEQVAGVRRSLWFLLGAVLLVLLAACGNVACLMLADAAKREQEVAIRFALGASRRAVLHQLLVEGLLLALGGAALGLLIAYWSTRLLRAYATQLPRVQDVHVDLRLIVFTFALGMTTTLLFALTPALQATRRDIAGRLAHGGRAQIGGRQLLQRALVAAQVALAIMLLVGAGLLIRSFARLQQTSPGFDTADVLTFRMSAQWAERTDAVMNRQLRTIARLKAIPGVLSAAFSNSLPAGIDFPPGEFRIAGRDAPEHLFAYGRSVSADYFRTLRIPLLQGEICRDDPAKPFQSVVVTRAFADRFFPGENPIGHVIQPVTIAGLQQRVDGIVGDVRENGVMKDAPALSYTCGLQPYWPDPYFIIRTDPARPASMSAIREALREIEPKRAIYSVTPLDDVLADSVSQQRLNTLLLTVFAVTALLLAAVGLYGTLSQFVSQRRREIGLRMALGAQPRQVLAQVVGHGAIVTAIGIAAGLAGALALSRLMATLVFGIPSRDPVTFAVVPLVLAAMAAAATIAPARRAIRVDPMEALRDD
jgi:putative ABC transport system permease protein